MAAARLTPTGTRLQAVHDGDVTREPISEDFCFANSKKGNATRKMSLKTGRQFVIPRAVPFLVVAGPKKRRRSCATKRPVLSRTPSQAPLALDRPRALARVKGYSLGTGRLTNKEKEESKALRPYMLKQVPKTRGECIDGPRPCYVMRCPHHLYVTVNPESGSIKLNFPNKLVEELEYTCSLDAADENRETGMTLERVGECTGLSLERVRQVEASGLAKLKAQLNPEAIRALIRGDLSSDD